MQDGLSREEKYETGKNNLLTPGWGRKEREGYLRAVRKVLRSGGEFIYRQGKRKRRTFLTPRTKTLSVSCI